jgi:hypothetical protein
MLLVKVRNQLWLAVIEKLKVFFVQTSHRMPVSIAHHHSRQDQVHIDKEARSLIDLRRRLLVFNRHFVSGPLAWSIREGGLL